VLASPGTTYVSSGPINVLDLQAGLLMVDLRTHKTYDIHFESSGCNVAVQASFTGTGYESRRHHHKLPGGLQGRSPG
jgi:hypothetical protein